ncbi:hypothetical protein J8J27_25465, partial [Mycobacterium tuberculosis]|nr:hypothetical protein [Mycobacterium tuberculosis]
MSAPGPPAPPLPLPLKARLSRRPTTAPDGETVVLAHDDGESPLTWLHRRRGRDGRIWVDTAEFAAGERLRADFSRAALAPLSSN